jgi:hypothetical protein
MSPESDLNESIKKSLLKDTKSALIDLAEASLDVLTKNDFTKELPIIKWVIKPFSIIDRIKTEFYIKKLQIFLINVSDLTIEEYEDFISKTNKIETEKLNKFLLITIDRINSEEKSVFIGRLFKLLVQKRIRNQVFLRSVNIIESLFIDDLCKFLSKEFYFSSTHSLFEVNINQSLVNLGLLEAHIVESNDKVKRVHNDSGLKFQYVESEYGRNFKKWCGTCKG